MTLPRRIKKQSVRQSDRIRCQGHLAWVRREFECSIARRADHRCEGPIEAAHVRAGTDAGMGIKPSDCFAISLCAAAHRIQHAVGEKQFEEMFRIDMKKLAAEFAKESPALKRYLAARKRAA